MLSSEYSEESSNLTPEEHITFAFVYDSITFCFWGDPKWTVEIDGEELDGSIAMRRCLQKAIDNGHDLLSAKFIKNMTRGRLETILRGNIEIPLLDERLDILHELGETIDSNYSGSFTSFGEKAGRDAVRLVELLAAEMPRVFADEANYYGHAVRFYKRAQILASHLWELHKVGVLQREISNVDKLTAFADYKVPQLLRKIGILEYDPELTQKVDRLLEIPAGSDEEIEIRATTIWAVELVTRAVKKQIPTACAADIGRALWFKSQDKSSDDKPYHRTRTVWY